MKGGLARRCAAACALALAAASAAAAQQAVVPPELSLEQAVALAQANNPELLSQRNDVEVARGAVRSALGDYLPTVTAGMGLGYTAPGERRSGSVVLAQQPAVYSSNYSLGAAYSLSGGRLYGARSAREERRATEARVGSQEANLAGEVTLRYVAAQEAAAQMDLAGRDIGRVEEHLRTARERLAAGQLTPLEVRRAEVQVGRAQIRRLRAANAYAGALLGLGRSLGVRVDSTVRLVTRMEVFEPRWQARELVERALAANPVLRSAAASAAAADARVRVARGAYLPTLSLGLGVNGWKQMSDEDALLRQRLGPGDHDSATVARVRQEVRAQNRGFPFGYNRQPFAASLSVQLPVFQGFGRAQQVRQARAAAQDARFQLRSEALRVEQETTTAFLDLKTAREAAGVAARVRDAAAEELAMTQERFRLGLANSLAVLDAQAQLSEAEQEQTTAAFDFQRALGRLESLVGGSLR